MADISELLDELEVAREELARYRRMLALLGAGTAGGILGILACVPMILVGVRSDATAAIMVPSAIIAIVCATCFIVRVTTANETTYAGESRHPATKVRLAEARYNRAILGER